MPPWSEPAFFGLRRGRFLTSVYGFTARGWPKEKSRPAPADFLLAISGSFWLLLCAGGTTSQHETGDIHRAICVSGSTGAKGRCAELEAIRYALQITNDNKARAAGLLGIHRTALYKKMKRYNLPFGPP